MNAALEAVGSAAKALWVTSHQQSDGRAPRNRRITTADDPGPRSDGSDGSGHYAGSIRRGHGRGETHGGAFRRFREQSYDVYRPMPSLCGALLVLSAVFAAGVGLGVPLLVASLRVVEVRVRYDDAPLEALLRGGNASSGSTNRLSRRELQQRALWAAGDAGVPHQHNLTVPRVMQPPVYLLYELPGFFATHKRYVRSISGEQLAGKESGANSLDVCRPRLYVDGSPNASRPASGVIKPCGLRATAFFNDTLTLAADPKTCGLGPTQQQDDSAAGGNGDRGGFVPLPLDEQGLEWPLESQNLYGSYNASNLNTVPPLRHGGAVEGPMRHATHFQVWMRPSARPTSLKLYGIIRRHLPAGCILRLETVGRYNTYSWDGEKLVVLTTQSWYGMRNLALPIVLLAVAAGALAGMALLLGLAACLPRAA